MSLPNASIENEVVRNRVFHHEALSYLLFGKRPSGLQVPVDRSLRNGGLCLSKYIFTHVEVTFIEGTTPTQRLSKHRSFSSHYSLRRVMSRCNVVVFLGQHCATSCTQDFLGSSSICCCSVVAFLGQYCEGLFMGRFMSQDDILCSAFLRSRL